MAVKNPPLKWHGGKTYQASHIIGLMPPRVKNPNNPAPDDPGWLHYVEPFFGGGAVLLAQDPEGISEVVNDLNGDLTNFWVCLRDTELFSGFQRQAEATPFSAHEYYANANLYRDCSPVTRALAFFVRCRQSMSGRMGSFAPLTRNRTRRGMNEQASAWLNCVAGLPDAHRRLCRVVILNDDALKVIKQQDGPRTLFYCDPPYLHETRETTCEYGDHEMSEKQHRELLEVLSQIKGRFILSGYHSALYDNWAKAWGWNCHELEIDNKSSSAKVKEKKIECCWTNY